MNSSRPTKFGKPLPPGLTDVRVEIALVVAVGIITALIALQEINKPLLLSLFTLPVVTAGLLLGSYRSGGVALLSVLAGGLAVMSNADPYELSFAEQALNSLVFLIWGATLGLTAVVTGLLSDRCRAAVEHLEMHHESERVLDGLTGVTNRRGFDEQLAKRVSAALRSEQNLTVIILDIDRFKNFNDHYGHDAGDAVIARIAGVLEESARPVDVVARYGGEEFVILVSDVSEHDANELAERIRIRVQSTYVDYQSLRLRVTASLGVAHLRYGEDVATLVKRADSALYHSKESGRNCTHMHDGTGCKRVGAGLLPDDVPTTRAVGDDERIIDEMTGVASRAVFLSELRRRMMESRRYHTPICIAVVGLNGYQQATNLGDRAVKDLVCTIAGLTASLLRESDFVARCSEDSLCVFLPNTLRTDCMIPLRRLCTAASELSDVRYPNMNFQVSVGLAELEVDAELCQEQFLERAIKAQNNARESGVGLFDYDSFKQAAAQAAACQTNIDSSEFSNQSATLTANG